MAGGAVHIKPKHRKALSRALQDKGITLNGVVRHTKHPFVAVTAGARTAFITVPYSPSCSRWVHNTVRNARRALELVS